TSWKWILPGGFPDTSYQQNPKGVCYSSPGTFPVTLIVANSTGTDTIRISPMITVGGTPVMPTITLVGNDTLISSHASRYQWYLDGNAIGGATDSSTIAHQPGTY